MGGEKEAPILTEERRRELEDQINWACSINSKKRVGAPDPVPTEIVVSCGVCKALHSSDSYCPVCRKNEMEREEVLKQVGEVRSGREVKVISGGADVIIGSALGSDDEGEPTHFFGANGRPLPHSQAFLDRVREKKDRGLLPHSTFKREGNRGERGLTSL